MFTGQRSQWLSVPAAAAALGVSPVALHHQLLTTGAKLPKHYTIGKRVKFRCADIDQWLREQVTTPEEDCYFLACFHRAMAEFFMRKGGIRAVTTAEPDSQKEVTA